jgi:hypothetical protein
MGMKGRKEWRGRRKDEKKECTHLAWVLGRGDIPIVEVMENGDVRLMHVGRSDGRSTGDRSWSRPQLPWLLLLSVPEQTRRSILTTSQRPISTQSSVWLTLPSPSSGRIGVRGSVERREAGGRRGRVLESVGLIE